LTVKLSSSTRIGKRPCNSGIKSLGLETWKAPAPIIIKQYEALLKTEEVTVNFSDEAITRLAEMAYQVNHQHTVVLYLLLHLAYLVLQKINLLTFFLK
jgi:ATP-dependent protease Clp ATPase subunit